MGQAKIQPQNLQTAPTNPEGTIVERTEPATEATALARIEIERTQIVVIEAQADVVPTFEAVLISTPMPHLGVATSPQDNPGTPSIAKTLMLLTTGSRFGKITTKVGSEYVKSSAGHTEKLLFEEPSTAYVLPNATEV